MLLLLVRLSSVIMRLLDKFTNGCKAVGIAVLICAGVVLIPLLLALIGFALSIGSFMLIIYIVYKIMEYEQNLPPD